MSWKYLDKSKISDERKYNVLRSPIITEKTTKASQYNQYAFEVAPDANKHEIKQAVESLFKVSVVKVNVSNLKGKSKRFRGTMGVQKDVKKAIVTLKQGDALDVGVGV